MNHDLRLIEAGFPCHQVGAETQRERDTGQAPPVNRLHVWWARRPLTPSRAAILASLLPADTDPEWFIKQLGIQKKVAEIGGQQWTLLGKVCDHIYKDKSGECLLELNDKVLKLLEKENERREENRRIIAQLKEKDSSLANDPVLLRWEAESHPIPPVLPLEQGSVPVKVVAADPAHVNERIAFAKLTLVKKILGKEIKWDPEDLYGYSRAFTNNPEPVKEPKTILDPTSGGGSIPFEALRLGHKVIANDLNPVATVILHATLEYPAKYGVALSKDIQHWGEKLLNFVSNNMVDVTPFSPLPNEEKEVLAEHCNKCPEIIPLFDVPEFDQTGLLYCRQVTCPHCGGEAPLLNTCWLSKDDSDPWGVKIITDGKQRNGKIHFEPYRVHKGKGPKGEDPNFATVNKAVGQCVHCLQAIEAEEIKRQARGESKTGTWQDRLYCVVAVRHQPKLDKHGHPERYKSGAKKDEIKTQKVRFFRSPNPTDLKALKLAEQRLQENWNRWDEKGWIPTESFPQGNDMRPVYYGMNRWCDMFTPRQLLGHLYLVEGLNTLKPQILQELGHDKGKAVVTYLQFMIDKGVDYNSKQTRWHYQRGAIVNTFGRHDFSLKWTYGEMIFSGENSGAAWGLNQVIDAYKGIVELSYTKQATNLIITHGTGSNLHEVQEGTVDLVCMDPPYYNNVQYAELSDYFYVWQKRSLRDLYPDYFGRRFTNKQDEAVANPDRDGSAKAAKNAYETVMRDIFAECKRILCNTGILTIMFTHKSPDAWETLTKSLIENGWIITTSIPVESETEKGIHTRDTASAISSVFLTCRKRLTQSDRASVWTGFGGSGVQQQIRKSVAEGLKEFASLNLNPVDEMVGSYGRALRVLSENWPVLDGDEPVGPVRAMTEASRVVAEYQVQRITKGRLKVEDLSPEAAMALTLFGIYGLNEIAFDEVLNLSRSLNITLKEQPGGYVAKGSFIGINTEASGTRQRTKGSKAEETGFQAPLVKKGSKLRLAKPDERDPRRLKGPQTEWDIMQGTLMAYRDGDVPVARAYLEQHANSNKRLILDLLNVWKTEVGNEKLQKEAEMLLYDL